MTDLIINTLIILLAVAIIGGFLDFLWHTGKLIQMGENGVTWALFLFFLSLLFAAPWSIVQAILIYFKIFDDYSFFMQIWRLISLSLVLVAMINMRLTLFSHKD